MRLRWLASHTPSSLLDSECCATTAGREHTKSVNCIKLWEKQVDLICTRVDDDEIYKEGCYKSWLWSEDERVPRLAGNCVGRLE